MSMLTTIDNEYNPYDDFVKWYERDMELKHNTCGRVATISKYFEDRPDAQLSDGELDDLTEKVNDFIVLYDPENIYIKVTEKS